MEKTENRRRYFRIDDVVDLNYRLIDEQDVTESSSRMTDNILSECTLATALEYVSQESARLLYRIDKSQPDIAHCIKLLDKKIDLLTQAIMMQGGEPDKKKSCEINLSASGLAFGCEKALDIGVFLELRMSLVSIGAVIITCCQVIQCKKNPSADGRPPFQISVNFVNMTEEDKELLIKHMVKRQMQQIREKSRKL